MAEELTGTPAKSDQQPMGQYYLMEKIARGGMAEIYKGIAYDLHGIKRTVVIKKILPHVAANPEFIDMLVAEAKIAVMLSHGNIAQIYDLGKAGDDYFIVMEYVNGRSVSQLQRECLARQERIPVPIACHIAAEIAAGLDYMHQRTDERGKPLHIVHRDVSPQNVLISYEGAVKIIDFGIAKARTKLETTDVGILKGKFAYMSPEHARGDPIDYRSDIFSLGVILYEMLTGKRLFKAKENRETLRNVRRAVVPLPSTLRPEISLELDAIVLKALAKEREERYLRAATLRDDLLRIIHREYPEFRPQEFADFIKTRFAHLETATEIAEEAKTPFLIIDHTQSAIALSKAQAVSGAVGQAVPAMMAEFMLPDECAEREQVEDAELEEASVTSRRKDWSVWLRGAWCKLQRRVPWRIVGWSALGLLVVMIAGETWRRGVWSPQRVWRAITPAEWVTRAVPEEGSTVELGSIVLTSDPAGATIFLDDRDTGLVTPATLENLPTTESHRIGLFLEGYKYWSGALSAELESPKQVTIPLAVDYGTLFVETTPVGADVLINGQLAGQAPVRQGELPPGAVLQVEVRLPGYASVQRSIRIRPGKAAHEHFVLVRGGEE